MSNIADLLNSGWNFVGNPYPSSIDWTSGSWTKTQIDAAAYVRDFEGGVYMFNDGTVSSTFNGIIATGQGFWVHANDDAGPQLGFSEQTKTTTTGTFYRMARPKSENRIAAVLSYGKFSDKAFIHLRKKASDAYDKGLDNFKMSNEIFNIATISGENHKFCIDYR